MDTVGQLNVLFRQKGETGFLNTSRYKHISLVNYLYLLYLLDCQSSCC